MSTIANLETLKSELGLASADTSEDSRLLRLLKAASASIEGQTNRRFLPYQASIFHSINLRQPQEILLRADLLELQSLKNGDGASISLDAVQILNDGALRLLDGASFIYTESPIEAIELTGIWGYHPNWETAWASSGDTVQNNPLSASATTITVTDADAGFQVGQLLKIGAEYLLVKAVDSETNSLSVERGAQGTVAVIHNLGASIAIYQVPPNVENLVIRWALWLYREADKTISDLPQSLRTILASLRRISV
jgi:hypothetical protein